MRKDRFQLLLDHWLKVELEAIARHKGISLGELIRDILKAGYKNAS